MTVRVQFSSISFFLRKHSLVGPRSVFLRKHNLVGTLSFPSHQLFETVCDRPPEYSRFSVMIFILPTFSPHSKCEAIFPAMIAN